ncbi:MAG: putative zinc-binding protein, partial [Chloroflexi bacterium]|nr:putative zinc-binding protein [Chloroflexota bacterium]
SISRSISSVIVEGYLLIFFIMEDEMAGTIQVRLTDETCELGDGYARKHLTSPAKTAVLACEGMCLRGDVARRAANLIAHELAPEKTVRVCHGGLLETSSGMRDLVNQADRVLLLDGCGLACGTRLLKGAMPEVKPVVAITNQLFESDSVPFGVEEVSEEEIRGYAREVAEKVLAKQLSKVSTSA